MVKSMHAPTRHNPAAMAGFSLYNPSPPLPTKFRFDVVHVADQRLEKYGFPAPLEAENDSKDTAREPIATISHSRISLSECLGKGSFSSVLAIRAIQQDENHHHHHHNNDDPKRYDAEQLVVKVLRADLIQNPRLFAKCAADLIKEGRIMSTLRHPYILRVRAWAPSGVESYSSGRHDAFFLVLERLDCTLEDRLEVWQDQKPSVLFGLGSGASKKAELLNERLGAILQLSSALRYLHSHRLLHRDLKPDNVGFRNGDLKIFDFDTTRRVPESADRNETFKMTIRIGSARYMAPEIANEEPYNLAADVYTFCLLTHELLTLEKPYTDMAEVDQAFLVYVRGMRPSIPAKWPPEIKRILENGWSPDVALRPRMAEIDDFFRERLVGLMAPASKPGSWWRPKRRAGRKTKPRRSGSSLSETSSTSISSSFASNRD